MERVHWEDALFEADYWLIEEPEGVRTAVLIPGTLKPKSAGSFQESASSPQPDAPRISEKV